MTTEEAILELCYISQYGYKADKAIIGYDRVDNALLMAKEALEKQIQEKPIGSGIEFICPRCLTTVGHIKKHGGIKITHAVCPCGQKLNWSDVE